MFATSAVSQLVIFGVLFSLINSLAQALKTILSSSHSYSNCFYLADKGAWAVALSFSMPSENLMSFIRVSNKSFAFPSIKPGNRVGQDGMSSCF